MKILLTAGAAALTITTSAVTAAPPAPKPKTVIVTASDCVVTGAPPQAGQQNFLAAVIAIVGPILAELAIDAVSAELKKVQTVKSEGSLDFNLWRRSDDRKSLQLNVPPCFTVITGEFENFSSKRIPTLNMSTAVPAKAPVATLLQRLADNGIKPTKLYSVFEAKIVSSDDHTAFKIVPLYFRSVELIPGNKAKKQGLIYNIALRGPGASPWGSVYALAPISIGDVEAGTEIHGGPAEGAAKLAKLTTGSLVIPGMSETAYAAYIQDWRDKDIAEFMPANLQAEVVQTKKPSDAALFLASILDKAKPKITEKIGAALNPDTAFAATQAKLDAEIAVKEAQKALADLKAAASPDQPAIDIAKLKLQKAEEKLESLQ